MHTFYTTRGIKQILLEAKNCLAIATSDRAISYRLSQRGDVHHNSVIGDFPRKGNAVKTELKVPCMLQFLKISPRYARTGAFQRGVQSCSTTISRIDTSSKTQAPQSRPENRGLSANLGTQGGVA